MFNSEREEPVPIIFQAGIPIFLPWKLVRSFFFPVYWVFQMRLCEGCQLPTQKTPPNSSTFEGAAGGWCQSSILYHSICELLCGRCVHI